jgi:hypothetical protein
MIPTSTEHDTNSNVGSAIKKLDIVVHFDHRGATLHSEDVDWFRNCLLPEALLDLTKAGVAPIVRWGGGWIERKEADALFHGVVPKAVNVFVTPWVPLCWDKGMGLCGLSGIAAGTDTVIVSTANAHRHLVPYLATNTLLHEFGHVLRGDLHRKNTNGWGEQMDELAVDRTVTHLHYGFVESQVKAWIAALQDVTHERVPAR